jgi:hypothetical protein
VACGTPQTSYPSQSRLALELVEASEGATALGPAGLAAYRQALEARLGPWLARPGEPATRVVVSIEQVQTVVGGGTVGTEWIPAPSALLSPTGAALHLLTVLGGDRRVRRKLADLDYPIQVPIARFTLLEPGEPGKARGTALDSKAVILAHERLMHGDRGPSSRVRAEAQAFAEALAQALRLPRVLPGSPGQPSGSGL